jgi:hypothetical protein
MTMMTTTLFLQPFAAVRKHMRIPRSHARRHADPATEGNHGKVGAKKK